MDFFREVRRRQAYEFSNPGKSSKGKSKVQPVQAFSPTFSLQMLLKPSESFIELTVGVDKFFSMSSHSRELGKQLLNKLLVDLVTVAEDRFRQPNAEQRTTKLKDIWLKENVLGVCNKHVVGGTQLVRNREVLVDLVTAEVGRIFGPNFFMTSAWSESR